jgi:cysteine desulfurase/selenocysteine lyase
MQGSSGFQIYLNHAAAGLMSERVLQTIQDHLRLEADCGGYVAAEIAQPRLDQSRQSLALLLNCTPAEIAFTDSASRAWQRILDCFDFQPGDIVMVSSTIWGGSYHSLLQLQSRRGIRIECMPCTAQGYIDFERLEKAMSPRIRLMELSWAGSGWDAWQPAPEIASIARQHGIPLVIDASQALGQRVLDVSTLGCDFLFASGRKWLGGPRGTGILYANRATTATLCPIGLDQHTASQQNGQLDWVADARRFELSETSVALRLALGVAAEETLNRLQNGQATQLQNLARLCRQMAADVPGLTLPAINGDLGAIVTLRSQNCTPIEARIRLRQHGIEVGVHPSTFMPLHPASQALGDCLRISPHVLNTPAELEYLFQIL